MSYSCEGVSTVLAAAVAADCDWQRLALTWSHAAIAADCFSAWEGL